MSTSKLKLSSKYGSWPELDSKIGNVRAVLKNGNPNKRYFLVVVDGEKEYFTDLIEARFAVKQIPTDYRVVTQDDLDTELATRGRRVPGGKYIDVTGMDDDQFEFTFMGNKYRVPLIKPEATIEGGAV